MVSLSGRGACVGIPVLVLLLIAWPTDAIAQRQIGALGVGGQAGLPGGASVKLYREDSIAYDLLVSTDLDDRAVLYLHRVWEQPIPESPLWIYFGPGLIGGAEQLTTEPAPILGVSSIGGLNFYAEHFEVFLQIIPRFQVQPDVKPRIGGSVGLRYYF
ncbi:RNA polymerase subunit sigma-54 [Longibacter salinarum]|uniref:RNA polymerase subunit sigma-54 n=1 Tax=Longibacter salinarum TaxID=1850348 RepID=A0A2A8CZ82_9BACT|nr:RNA polymerase subunit sigma-54 [Longibacter salinarum]